jgi:hypothetical protein
MTRPDDQTLARLSAALVARAGGYLRNPVCQEGVTCVVCARPITSFRHCYRCAEHRQQAGLADACGFLTYAVAGQQSGYVMRGYKAPRPLYEHRTIVALLLYLGLAGHAQCAAVLAGSALTHWAAVPSLPARPGEHPFRRLAASLAPGREIRLTATANPGDPRGLSADHFSARQPLPRGSHVLLLDDTWASGGHAQSAALALRRAGAARISVLVVARWLSKSTELAQLDYDPACCPWTGGECPKVTPPSAPSGQ